MGNIYKVMVVRGVERERSDGSTYQQWDDVIELAAPVEMLRQFAPSAVAAALGATAPAETDDGLNGRSGVAEPEGNIGPGQPKRRRRTKAEMEAARAAENLDKVQSAQVPVESVEMPSPEAVTATDPEKAEPQPAYNPFA